MSGRRGKKNRGKRAELENTASTLGSASSSRLGAAAGGGGKTRSLSPSRGDSAKEALIVQLHRTLYLPPHSPEPTQVVDLMPEQPGFILHIPHLFAPNECEKLINVMQTVGLNPANERDLHPRRNEAFLNRSNLAFRDDDFARHVLWPRLADHVPAMGGRAPVGLFSRLRYYSYERGQCFGPHVDVSQAEEGLVSEFTLLVYLNGEAVGEGSRHQLQGGHTVFHASKKRVLCRFAPRQGSALLHAHGRRCLLHEGEEVTKGVKFVLRSDIMFAAGRGCP